MLTIYKASAGSGKTFQLALFYLKMVLGIKTSSDSPWRLNPNLLTDAPSLSHRRILAITFTNKATEEMKSRIVASLNDVANAQVPTDHDYIIPLIEELGCSFEQLRTAARHAMMSILLDFSFFNVSTIDSFFQSILRTFARELGIQGDYNIEIDDKDVIGRALNLLVSEMSVSTRSATDRRLARVRDWIAERTGQSKSKYNPFKLQSHDYTALVNMVHDIFSEDFKPLQEELFRYFEDTSKLETFKNKLENILSDIPEEMKRVADETETAFLSSDNAALIPAANYKLVMKLREGPDAFAKPGKGLTSLLAGEREIDSGLYKLNKKGSKTIPADSVFIAAMDALAESITDIYRRYSFARMLLRSVPQLEFISLISYYIERVKEDENVIILDDTSTYISRIIGGSEIPFIYEHLGTHLRHFLIDEFQDTSRLQWKNLLPLVANSHANGDDSLIIGDVKQAIYRFRNSDASILGYDLENIDFTDDSNRTIRGQTADENRNFRTAHGIVRFNNTILPEFASLILGQSTPSGYTGAQIIQQCAPQRADLDSRIALIPVFKEDPGNDELGTIHTTEDGLNATIINEIKRQIDSGEFKKSDIAILFRNKNNVKDLINDLLDAGIEVQSAESLYLRNAPSIRLMVSLLYMLADAATATPSANGTETEPETTDAERMDQVLFESRYNYFLYHGGPDGTPLSPAEAIEMALSPDSSDSAAATSSVPKTLDQTIRLILHKHPATLVAVIEAILSAGLIPETIVNKEKDYIAAFTDLAIDYCDTQDSGDILGFLAWWQVKSKNATITPPPDCDAVHLMSIHKAKGLEFKCVHLVDFNWNFIGEESIWLNLRPETGNHLGIDLEGISADIFPPLINIGIGSKTAIPQLIDSPLLRFQQQQQQLMRIDALNIAYVALTRAQCRLNVYFSAPAPDADIKKINNVGTALAVTLRNVMANPPSHEKSLLDIPAEAFNPNTGAILLEIAPTAPLSTELIASKLKEKARKEQQQEFNRIFAEKYNNRYTSTFRTDMDSVVNVESLENDPEETVIEEEPVTYNSPAMRSNYDLCAILARIPYLHPGEDIRTAINSAIESAARSPLFDTTKIDNYILTVEKMLTDNRAAAWFDPRNHIDTEISYTLRDLTNHRVNRLVEYPDGSIDLINYAFGTDVDIDKAMETLRLDSIAIGNTLPGHKIRSFLWIPDLNIIHSP